MELTYVIVGTGQANPNSVGQVTRKGTLELSGTS